MSQNDPIIIEEYRNPLIEFSRSIIFLQNSSSTTNVAQMQQQSENNNVDSVFIQLILYWFCSMNDARNLKSIYIPYYHSLNTLKAIFLSSGNSLIHHKI
jgi:hypothetical protein